MNWNAARYYNGFPPERWYEIADELGILIQDEFPIWHNPIIGAAPPELTGESLAGEYEAWMRERWNHPCVVIWDAQNESLTPVTLQALRRVRGLDLSDRPWDNGWEDGDRPTDVLEYHPYIFQKPEGTHHGPGEARGRPRGCRPEARDPRGDHQRV
jgi:beta-galactosidase/beta-glucuronidase